MTDEEEEELASPEPSRSVSRRLSASFSAMQNTGSGAGNQHLRCVSACALTAVIVVVYALHACESRLKDCVSVSTYACAWAEHVHQQADSAALYEHSQTLKLCCQQPSCFKQVS